MLCGFEAIADSLSNMGESFVVQEGLHVADEVIELERLPDVGRVLETVKETVKRWKNKSASVFVCWDIMDKAEEKRF